MWVWRVGRVVYVVSGVVVDGASFLRMRNLGVSDALSCQHSLGRLLDSRPRVPVRSLLSLCDSYSPVPAVCGCCLSCVCACDSDLVSPTLPHLREMTEEGGFVTPGSEIQGDCPTTGVKTRFGFRMSSNISGPIPRQNKHLKTRSSQRVKRATACLVINQIDVFGFLFSATYLMALGLLSF